MTGLIATATAGFHQKPVILTIFAGTYLGIAMGRVPGLKLNRVGIALLGAIAMQSCSIFDCADDLTAAKSNCEKLFRALGGGTVTMTPCPTPITNCSTPRFNIWRI